MSEPEDPLPSWDDLSPSEQWEVRLAPILFPACFAFLYWVLWSDP
jgi:hypothetical protein